MTYPFIPLVIRSLEPAYSLATTTQLAASASGTGSAQLSCWLGRTKTSAAE